MDMAMSGPHDSQTVLGDGEAHIGELRYTTIMM
jgi:hypothetical protein